MSGLKTVWTRGSFGRFVSMLLIAGLVVPSQTADTLVSAEPAPLWPEHWTVVDDDAVDGGDAFQDVVSARTAWDESYLYLSLETAAAPSCALNARYSWFLGVGETSGLQLSGNTLEGATHLLFVEDAGDGSCAIYLLPANGDDTFSAYQASAYVTDPGPALASVAGSRVDGNHIEMYVRLGELEVDGVVPTSPL
ncbi:MAG: hypothetical protein JXA58_04345, partial [Dehalococcoidia bacterium]|nr:hypothetical protein [Dehalococcoidia bacterium]